MALLFHSVKYNVCAKWCSNRFLAILPSAIYINGVRVRLIRFITVLYGESCEIKCQQFLHISMSLVILKDTNCINNTPDLIPPVALFQHSPNLPYDNAAMPVKQIGAIGNGPWDQ